MQFNHLTADRGTIQNQLGIRGFARWIGRLVKVFSSFSRLGLGLSIALGSTTSSMAQPEKPLEDSLDQHQPPLILLNEKEKKFKETLTGAVFNGYWRLKQEGKLTEAKKEIYQISGITKVTEKGWIVQATIAYGSHNVTVPVPVNVEWADDTPVISVTRLGIPGLGTYSARVLVFDDCYSGVWSGPDYGGLLSGVIEKKSLKSN